jgi:hypothetical protein
LRRVPAHWSWRGFSTLGQDCAHPLAELIDQITDCRAGSGHHRGDIVEGLLDEHQLLDDGLLERC